MVTPKSLNFCLRLQKFVSNETTSEAANLSFLEARSCLCDLEPNSVRLYIGGKEKNLASFTRSPKCVFFRTMYPLPYLRCFRFRSLEGVWPKIIRLQSIWTKCLGRNDVQSESAAWLLSNVPKWRQRCRSLGFFEDKFQKENLHFRLWNFGEWLSYVYTDAISNRNGFMTRKPHRKRWNFFILSTFDKHD